MHWRWFLNIQCNLKENTTWEQGCIIDLHSNLRHDLNLKDEVVQVLIIYIVMSDGKKKL